MEYRGFQLVEQIGHLRAHLNPQLHIQVAQRLVQQHDGRLGHQRPGDGHTLLLSSGKLRRIAAQKPVQMEQSRNLVHPSSALLFVHLLDFQAVGDIVLHLHMRPQGKILKHHIDASFFRRQVVMGAGYLLAPDAHHAFIQRQDSGNNP